ncbi:hypothetical protein B0J11DRAFT_439442 [Dendryphion nanum]|uniref:C3H1-type domain-containing protein n=1 Tax=Dendryphion nanum TaxID=256645 RepID=A0A9P9IHM0_9PLEO|nr:hypothetical protein B0J11DRAFT_439442 [Dendryphion nanum]
MGNNHKAICHQFQNSGFCSYGTNCRFSHVRNPRYKVHYPDGKRVRYPDFAYDDTRGVAEEFYRMCDFFAWGRNDDKREKARQAFKDAMVIRFNGLYGTDISNIENWHKICVAVHIEPLPSTIADCKEKIKEIHVNLVDLVDTSGQDVELFESLDDLREYTIDTGKFFPKQSAYAGGVLKFLLREIL